MRVAVAGSIANDYLMTFPGKFRDHIVPDQLARLSLSFLIDELEIRRGGVAANIAFGMGKLGLRPLLVGAVGRDFVAEYQPHLEAAGVDTSAVRVSDHLHTAIFLCTSDEEENQIASFYAGAMAEASAIDLAAVGAEQGAPDLVVVCPDAPDAMIRHTRTALEQGWPVAADPSQQLPRLDGRSVRELIDGASYLLSNDYEASLIESKCSWSSDEVLQQVGSRITTYGPKGCVIEQRGEPACEVRAVPPRSDVTLEPTGIGDAFRAGFVSGLASNLPLERCAQLGALIATLSLETVGPQEYCLEVGPCLDRFAQTYGDEAAADIESLLVGVHPLTAVAQGG